MKKEELFEAMGEMDPRYVHTVGKRAFSVKRSVFLKWGVSAACLALVILAGIRIFTPTSLPLLTITKNEYGMGMEAYQAYDIAELVNSNPYSEQLTLTRLPVYKNVNRHNSITREGVGAGTEKMKALLISVAKTLNMDTETLTITDNRPNERERESIIKQYNGAGLELPEGVFEPTAVMAEQNGIEIEVTRTLTVTVRFNPAVSLPDTYDMTGYPSYEDFAALAEYLKEEFAQYMNMETPKANISGGDYNIHLDQKYNLAFYESNGNITEQIVNYNFHTVTFSCNSKGDLFISRIYKPDLSEKVGDYPIITVAEARTLLENGHYITTVPDAMPGMEYVAKTELIYRADDNDEYFMPYYRFYVELPEKTENDGLKTYGAYYVPAVEKQYLTDMPLWDGSFN